MKAFPPVDGFFFPPNCFPLSHVLAPFPSSNGVLRSGILLGKCLEQDWADPVGAHEGLDGVVEPKEFWDVGHDWASADRSSSIQNSSLKPGSEGDLEAESILGLCGTWKRIQGTKINVEMTPPLLRSSLLGIRELKHRQEQHLC